jgi:hypothetical protein
MHTIDIQKMSDADLKEHHEMMTECVIKVEAVSKLAVSLWQEVLKELDRRHLVRLIAGSYDDVGNAHIQKCW